MLQYVLHCTAKMFCWCRAFLGDGLKIFQKIFYSICCGVWFLGPNLGSESTTHSTAHPFGSLLLPPFSTSLLLYASRYISNTILCRLEPENVFNLQYSSFGKLWVGCLWCIWNITSAQIIFWVFENRDLKFSLSLEIDQDQRLTVLCRESFN